MSGGLRRGLLATAVAAGLVLPAFARADDAPDAAPADHDWEISIAPYAWVPDVIAHISTPRFSVQAQPHLADLISDLDLAAMGTIDVFHAPTRLSFTVDAFWMRLTVHDDFGPGQVGFGPLTFTSPGLQKQVGPIQVDTPAGGLSLGPFDVDTGPISTSVPRGEFPVGPFDVKQTMTESAVRASVGYRVLDYALADLLGHEVKDDPRRVRADVYAGGRYWYVKTRVQLHYPAIEIPGLSIDSSLVAFPRLQLPSVSVGGVTFGGANVDEEKSTWWIDPLIGVRVLVDLTPRLGLLLNANGGGFGIGSASEWSWEGLAVLTWKLGEHWTLGAGYRGLGVDRHQTVAVSLIMHGPMLGIIYRFYGL